MTRPAEPPTPAEPATSGSTRAAPPAVTHAPSAATVAGDDLARVVTDTRLVLSAEAIVPGHCYSARLSDLAAGDPARPAELTSWVLDAPSAVAALHRLIDRERDTGGLDRDEANYLHQQVDRYCVINDAAPGSGSDALPSGDEHLVLDNGGADHPRACVTTDQRGYAMQRTKDIGTASGAPPGSNREHRHDRPRPDSDQPPPAPPTGPPAAEPWYDTVRRIASQAVVHDPGWAVLAAGLIRAVAAGWDAATGLPRLVTQDALRNRQPAAEVYYRLLADCAAADHPSTVSVEDINHATPPSTTDPGPDHVDYLAPGPTQRGPNPADSGPRR